MLQNILNSKTSTLEGQGRRNAVKDINSGNYKKIKDHIIYHFYGYDLAIRNIFIRFLVDKNSVANLTEAGSF